MEREEHYFGEWVFWDSQEDLEDAYKYLALWKKFFLKEVPNMISEGDDQIILRPPMPEESLAGLLPNMGRGTLGIKFVMKGKLPENVLSLKERNI